MGIVRHHGTRSASIFRSVRYDQLTAETSSIEQGDRSYRLIQAPSFERTYTSTLRAGGVNSQHKSFPG